MPQAEAKQELHWVDAQGGYGLALQGKKLLCRNPKGTQLKSVPKKVRDSDVAQQMLALRDWLAEHRQGCLESVETWMLRSLPVPLEVLARVWDDPAWHTVLENAVVLACDAEGTPDADQGGYLRGAEDKRGLGVVNLDGETDWLQTDHVLIPHPILLEDLTDYRELGTELSLEQGISQLFRETFSKPADLDPEASQVSEFSMGRFEQLLHATSRAQQQGYRVRGGFATCTVWEVDAVVEARYWIGAEYPEGETWTGELGWVDARERTLNVGDIGPVAYSEGMRMAGAIYAGRAKDEEEEGR